MLIDKEDAIQAICKACYMYKYVNEHYRDCKYYPCDDVTALEAVPEAPKPTGDLVSRADAIEAVRFETGKLGRGLLGRGDILDIISSLPSAEGGDADMNEVKPQYMQASPSNGADLIRREDAIDVVTDIQDGSGQRYYLAVSLVDKIRSLPSAEAVQGEWIPCSEMLPKPWENVMTTICWVGDEYEDDYDIAVGFKKISGDWDLTLADGTGVIKGFLVQAWMPLPKPYKGGDTE